MPEPNPPAESQPESSAPPQRKDRKRGEEEAPSQSPGSQPLVNEKRRGGGKP
ncbi:MAG TPA: hypothetical protein VFE33_09940 [Thermoanaerobaculia bacterium]|nr:hypothetical protein [Thermoanaerobaculia bacterium]